jgi:hypothetical protein
MQFNNSLLVYTINFITRLIDRLGQFSAFCLIDELQRRLLLISAILVTQFECSQKLKLDKKLVCLYRDSQLNLGNF